MATTPATALAAHCLAAGEYGSVRVELEKELLERACFLDDYSRERWIGGMEREDAVASLSLIEDYFKEYPLKRKARTPLEVEGLQILEARKGDGVGVQM